MRLDSQILAMYFDFSHPSSLVADISAQSFLRGNH